MKILIVKPSSFGDIIQANPVVQAVKSKWHDCTLDWLVFDRWKQAVELFPNVDNIIVWNRNGGIKAFFEVLKKCREQRYDLVIDLQGLLRTALFVRFLNAEKKIGVSGMKELSWLILKEPYKRDKKENALIRNLNSLSYITKEKYEPRFEISANEVPVKISKGFNISEKDFNIAFIPFSRGKTKTWKSENYAELAKKIKEENKNINILVLGSQKDFGRIKSENVIDMCGKTDIKELAAVLSLCKFAVGADTGAMHLANGLGIKNVFIFGGSDVNETSPFGVNSKVISANLPCSPCRGRCKFNIEKCLDEITPGKVFESIEQWIK